MQIAVCCATVEARIVLLLLSIVKASHWVWADWHATICTAPRLRERHSATMVITDRSGICFMRPNVLVVKHLRLFVVCLFLFFILGSDFQEVWWQGLVVFIKASGLCYWCCSLQGDDRGGLLWREQSRKSGLYFGKLASRCARCIFSGLCFGRLESRCRAASLWIVM